MIVHHLIFLAFVANSFGRFNILRRTTRSIEKKIQKCLIANSFYHKRDDRCEEPFQQGPCKDGYWMMLDTLTSGQVTCQRRPERFIDCKEVILGPGGQPQCATDLENETLFSSCGGGSGVIIPENFVENTMSCPHEFKCQEKESGAPSTKSYWASLSLLKVDQDQEAVKSGKAYLKSMVCNFETKSICVPVKNRNALLANENIIKSFQRPKTSCQRNPCSVGKWPWIDNEGYLQCVPIREGTNITNCPLGIEENSGELTCSLFTVRSIFDTARFRSCRKGMRFVFGKCRKRNRG